MHVAYGHWVFGLSSMVENEAEVKTKEQVKLTHIPGQFTKFLVEAFFCILQVSCCVEGSDPPE